MTMKTFLFINGALNSHIKMTIWRRWPSFRLQGLRPLVSMRRRLTGQRTRPGSKKAGRKYSHSAQQQAEDSSVS